MDLIGSPSGVNSVVLELEKKLECQIDDSYSNTLFIVYLTKLVEIRIKQSKLIV